MKKGQILNVILIIIGATALLYHFMSGNDAVAIQIFGIIFLMIGAYRASAHWSVHKDDHLDNE
ncbi:MAG: hypothetical protein WBG46_13275 [Nonlabens sp.]